MVKLSGPGPCLQHCPLQSATLCPASSQPACQHVGSSQPYLLPCTAFCTRRYCPSQSHWSKLSQSTTHSNLQYEYAMISAYCITYSFQSCKNTCISTEGKSDFLWQLHGLSGHEVGHRHAPQLTAYIPTMLLACSTSWRPYMASMPIPHKSTFWIRSFRSTCHDTQLLLKHV